MNIAVVIPTIRSLDFLSEWKGQFADCQLIIVEDHPTQQIETPRGDFKKVDHYCWQSIHSDFGDDEWIFPRQNAGIRTYGFWKAYSAGADIIITLDDDCYPTGDGFVQTHVENLRSNAPTDWFPTFPHPNYMYTRGFPYDIRNKQRVVMSHGLWSNKMDMDARTQLSIGDVNIPSYPPMRQFVPPGQFFPMSSMNLAFTRDIVPLMYFPLMGSDPRGEPWGFDRYDDIWAGVFAKKIIDHLGLSVVNGSPFVEHKKASDPHKNLIKEKTGMSANETLWHAVDRVKLSRSTASDSYGELADKLLLPKQRYFTKLQKAMKIWSLLFG